MGYDFETGTGFTKAGQDMFLSIPLIWDMILKPVTPSTVVLMENAFNSPYMGYDFETTEAELDSKTTSESFNSPYMGYDFETI